MEYLKIGIVIISIPLALVGWVVAHFFTSMGDSKKES
jgi:hypothetical protein